MPNIQQHLSKTKKQQYQVTSLRPECLEKLRNSSSSQEPKTHLLAYMSEFLDDKQEKQPEQTDQFCCFDRIKRILNTKKNLTNPGKHNNNLIQEDEKYKITKVIQLQARMKKMENSLEKYAHPTTTNSNSTTTNVSFHHKKVQKPKLDKKSQKYHQTAISRQLMIQKLKQQAYTHYAESQKQKIVDHQSMIKEYIQQQIQKKVDKVLSEQDIAFNQLSLQKKKLEHQILEKNLQIETIKTKQAQLIKKIQDLQLYRQLVFQSQQNKKKQTENQKLAKQFIYAFPNMSVVQVERQIQNLNDKCLNKFYDIQCKNWDKWNQEKAEYMQRIQKLQRTIQTLKKKQNQLLSNINTIKYEHSLATMEVDTLIKDKTELESLQKKILSVYNDWYGARSQSEKALMKNLGYLKQNYQYEEMLDYIVMFREKLSTNDKVNQYLIKILRGIMRIRKILFPKQNNDKLEPLNLLDKLESYVKCKVYQKTSKKGNILKDRSNQKLEEQFLFLHNKQNIE